MCTSCNLEGVHFCCSKLWLLEDLGFSAWISVLVLGVSRMNFLSLLCVFCYTQDDQVPAISSSSIMFSQTSPIYQQSYHSRPCPPHLSFVQTGITVTMYSYTIIIFTRPYISPMLSGRSSEVSVLRVEFQSYLS